MRKIKHTKKKDYFLIKIFNRKLTCLSKLNIIPYYIFYFYVVLNIYCSKLITLNLGVNW